MRWKKYAKAAVVRAGKLFGHDLDKLSFESALGRCLRRGTPVRTVIDVGASNGMWSAKTMKLLPDASYLLVEAQSVHERALRAMRSKHRNVDYVLAAAGDADGTIYFDDSDPFGGQARRAADRSAQHAVPMTTLDSAVRERNLAGPFLVKLDTHGFEVPILQGASRVLKDASLLVIEAYNFDIADQSLRFPALCLMLEGLGFRCVDLCEPLWRPHDGAFWQVDLFFVRGTEDVFQSNSYAQAR